MAQTAPRAVSRALMNSSDEIFRIAQQADPESTGVLSRLSRLLRDEPAGFVGVELARFYPPEVLLPDRLDPAQERIARILVAARDGLVFLPVAITWLFLSRAFAKEIPQGQTFLSTWGTELTITAVFVSLA